MINAILIVLILANIALALHQFSDLRRLNVLAYLIQRRIGHGTICQRRDLTDYLVTWIIEQPKYIYKCEKKIDGESVIMGYLFHDSEPKDHSYLIYESRFVSYPTVVFLAEKKKTQKAEMAILNFFSSSDQNQYVVLEKNPDYFKSEGVNYFELIPHGDEDKFISQLRNFANKHLHYQ